MIVNNKKTSVVSILPVVIIQFLSGFNENLLRSVFIVSIAFAVRSAASHHDAVVNLVNVFMSIPVILFSSYTGKIADKYNKVSVIRGVTVYQLFMGCIAAICIYYDFDLALMLILFAVALQQTFLYSVRLSIISDYVNTAAQIGLATSYIEFAWFTSSLIGQIFGSIAITNHKIKLLATVIMVSSILSLIFGWLLKRVHKPLIINSSIKLHGNPLKDFWLTFKRVTKVPYVLLNMSVIAWLSLFGAVNTAQMAIFVSRYIGADGHVFAIFLGFGTFGMGVGAILCAKIFRGKIKREVIVISGILLSICSMVIILPHPHLSVVRASCREFIPSFTGLLLFGAVFVKSIAFGFCSLTSYTEAQLLTKDNDRSQSLSMISIMIALYVTIGSLICYVAQLFISSWAILFIVNALNFVLALLYWKKITSMKHLQVSPCNLKVTRLD